jgi:hypothetical protein
MRIEHFSQSRFLGYEQSSLRLATHRQYARATFASPGAGVFEVKDNGVLARLERGAQPVFASHAALPTKLLEWG